MRKYQYYNTGDDADRDIYGVNWSGQTFTPELGHMIANVRVKLFRVGDPSTITISIKETSAGKPVGADLCSGTIEGNTITDDAGGDWYQISMGNGCEVERDVQYAIVIQASSGDVGNKLSWRTDASAPTYAGGLYCGSSDSGTDWNTFAGSDAMFEEWGAGAPSTQAVVWGNLYKSQISLEKIETAVLRMIQDHEDDEDAHLEAGESLYSHKASEIIDHLINSIITDKIDDGAVVNIKIDAPARAYTAIVDIGGDGDFTDIQLAINAVEALGGGNILIRPGTYEPTSSIQLYDDIEITGSKKSECIVDFGIFDAYFKTGVDAGVYSVGDISIANNTKIITGNGTTWDASGVLAGEYIRIKTLLYKITSVDNDTQLTLETQYEGVTIANETDYDIQAYLSNINIKNITIKNGGEALGGGTYIGAIDYRFVRNSMIENCDSIDSKGHSFELKNTFQSKCIRSQAINPADKGIYLWDACNNYIARDLNFGCNAEGIYLYNNSFDNTIVYNTASQNNIGIKSASDRNIIIGNRCNENLLHGIAIYGQSNIVNNNITFENGAQGIFVYDHDNTINDNISKSNGDTGIYIYEHDRNIIKGNVVKDNISHGIYLYNGNDRCIIIGNDAENNGGYGVKINKGASTSFDNIIALNTLLNNTSGAIDENGTDTEIAHNITT